MNNHLVKLFSLGVIVLYSTVFSGCVPLVIPVVAGALSATQAKSEQAKKDANKKPELTQLQTRELQTREYDYKDTNLILRVALAVIQDDGFVLRQSDADVGLLTASKNLHETNVDDSGTAFVKGFMGIGGVSSQKFSTVEVNVTVTPFGEKTRVRLSARLSSSEYGTGGANINYEAVTDPKFYQAFFAKLEKGLFIKQENL